MRTILKKWYKFQQYEQAKKFSSHLYIRLGWLDESFNNQEQLKDLFEIHSPKKLTFTDCFMYNKIINSLYFLISR